jgi:tetratricopeptide (TPR) repeat protein
MVLGVNDEVASAVDAAVINSKLRKFIGHSFHCRYTTIRLPIGGTRKTLAVIFVTPRKGLAVPVGCNAPGLFKEGEIFLRANDARKRAQTDADFLFANTVVEPDVLVGSSQLRTESPRPGVKLFKGDYATFFGEVTREPLIASTIDQLILGKWDVVLLRGVGGVGKTAVGIEITRRLAYREELKRHFGGIISLSAKNEQLTAYDRKPIDAEITSYDQFLHKIIINSDWEGNVPQEISQKEVLSRDILKRNNILLFIDNFETIESRESRISKFLDDLPPGVKTLITSRHQPPDLPARAVDVNPLDANEAKLLALSEAAAQHVDTATTDRFLNDILNVSARIPLAIKWIISCSRNVDHLMKLIEDHRHGKPSLASLCEFCFTFEYKLLKETARAALVLFPLFHSAPTVRELAVAADVDEESMRSALDELINFSLVMPQYSATTDEQSFKILRLTNSFASSKLREMGDLERQARRRLKGYYGVSIPVLVSAAKDMVDRGVTAPARQYIDQEILDRDPGNAMALFLRGHTFEQELHYAAALEDYTKSFGAAKNDPTLSAEVMMRILSLSKTDPQYSGEALLPQLERAYAISKDARIASEIAKIFEMLNKTSHALDYYEKIFRNSAAGGDVWDEAFVFICRHVRESQSPKAALHFVHEAQKLRPGSGAVSRWERLLMEEEGKLHIKRPGVGPAS